jgi:hypothetical protein
MRDSRAVLIGPTCMSRAFVACMQIGGIETLASIFCGATIGAFAPQLLGSLVTKKKEEELGWHQ